MTTHTECQFSRRIPSRTGQMTSTATTQPRRDTRVIQVLAIILVANLGVTAATLIYGFWVGSSALVADGFHSAVDASNNVVALFIARAAAAPPDDEHPYGHRKFEVIGSMLIGVMILLMVWEVGREAVGNLLDPTKAPVFGIAAYIVQGSTITANVIITTLEHRFANRLQSPLLAADAKHTLADIFVKLGVLGGIIGVQLGLPRADAVVALGVLGFIAYIGYGIVRRSLRVLTDEAVIPVEDVREVARAVSGVLSVRRIRSRGPGGDVRVDLIIEVDAELTVASAHDIADEVERAVLTRWPDVSEVVVHTEPA